jgi:hypothetical protein
MEVVQIAEREEGRTAIQSAGGGCRPPNVHKFVRPPFILEVGYHTTT